MAVEASRRLVIEDGAVVQLSALLGSQITGYPDLKGAIWAMRQRVAELEAELEQAKRRGEAAAVRQGAALPPGTFVLKVDDYNMMGPLENFAEHEGKTVNDFVQEQFEIWMTQLLGMA